MDESGYTTYHNDQNDQNDQGNQNSQSGQEGQNNQSSQNNQNTSNRPAAENTAALAKQAYRLIDDKANSNTVVQGLSGILGFPFTLMADGVVVFTHYGPMLNDIRALYNRKPVNEEILTPLVKGMFGELMFDLLFDKVLGQVPILGIYFNAICAKAMTWRLGILFSVLSSRGEELDEQRVKSAAELVRRVFPQDDAFSFKQPKYDTFEGLVASVQGTSGQEFDDKVNRALEIFRS